MLQAQAKLQVKPRHCMGNSSNQWRASGVIQGHALHVNSLHTQGKKKKHTAWSKSAPSEHSEDETSEENDSDALSEASEIIETAQHSEPEYEEPHELDLIENEIEPVETVEQEQEEEDFWCAVPDPDDDLDPGFANQVASDKTDNEYHSNSNSDEEDIASSTTFEYERARGNTSSFSTKPHGLHSSSCMIDFTGYYRLFLSHLVLRPELLPESALDRLHRVAISSLVEMFKDRGVPTNEIPDSNTLHEAFLQSSGNGEPLFTSSNGLVLIMLRTEKFGVSETRKIIACVQQNQAQSETKTNLPTIIVVSQRPPTSQARKELQASCKVFGAVLSIFLFAELNKPFPKHLMVPAHTGIVVNSDEERQLLKRLRCKKSNMPLLLADSPICRWYGWPIGTVVRIDRQWGGYNQRKHVWRVVSRG